MSTRRRIAGFILLVGALYLGARFIDPAGKLVSATIVYQVPAGATRLEAEARPSGSDTVVARFVSEIRGAPTELRQKTRVEPGSHELSITLTGTDGDRTVKRTVTIASDAVVTVDLTR